jgi:hypothetical protein
VLLIAIYRTCWIDPDGGKRIERARQLSRRGGHGRAGPGWSRHGERAGHPRSTRTPSLITASLREEPHAAATSASARCLSEVSSNERWTWFPGGLYDYGGRYYGPTVRRWTQMDPSESAR